MQEFESFAAAIEAEFETEDGTDTRIKRIKTA